MSAPAHLHAHGGAGHVHANVDRLTGDVAESARLLVRLDPALSDALGVAPGDVVRLQTIRGRSLLVRLDEPRPDDRGSGVIRLDRFARQALKAHVDDELEIERATLRTVRTVELLPAVDVTLAHDLVPHLKQTLIEQRTPLSIGAILYVRFPNANAGTTYEVHRIEDGPGTADEATKIVIHIPDAHLPEGAFDVTYDDIGGLGAQIRLIRELVQLPLRHPNVYRQLGINAPRGIILYGPPGAGKTHLARAVANEVDARLYYINGPDVIGTYAGESEGNLRRMFAEASHHAPSIVFIDELDAIAPKRGETGAHSDIRLVTQLLALMDGLTRVDAVIVIGTTNRLDAVDPAFRRAGRFDREIFIGPPNTPGRREILDIQTREMPLTTEAERFLETVARRTHGFVGADLMELCRDAGLNALRRSASALDDPRAAFRLVADELRVDERDFAAALEHVRPSALRETLITIPEVAWADVGGLAAVKQRLQELVQEPLLHSDALAAAGLATHAGVLLHGPPGTGKTLLAKALANECGVNFIAIDGPELFTKWLGESEEAVRHVFRIARQVAPTIVFFDQLDAIAPVRGRHDGSMTTERVVNQLLAELDGIESLARVVVLGATNRIDLVDPALLRPGRFGAHVAVPLPTLAERVEILRIHLTSAHGSPDEGAVVAAAERAAGWSGAQLRQAADEAKRSALRVAGYRPGAVPSGADLLAALALTIPTGENDR